ncbi:MAG: YCII-related domain protein [Segetibacter sp.]|jgi:hypothetical protein|nr:YCII-related domain protein [Segetibacter sp.]
MDKKHFPVKLLPAPANFAQPMAEDERVIMRDHAPYWTPYLDKGMVQVFGPVFGPKGVYGPGIV